MGRFALYLSTVCLLVPVLIAAELPATRSAPAAKRSSAPREPAEIVISDCRVKLLNEVQLSSARSGILELAVSEGEAVKSGTVVARLRDRLQQVSRAIAQREASNDIDVRFARKASELAQAKFLRAVDANKSAAGTVSELEMRELRLAAEKSLLQIEQAEHQFEIAGLKRDEAEENVSLLQVVAPFDGIVLDVYKHPGEVVREGEQIVRLGSAARVRVEGYVPVDQASRIRRGLAVQARLQSDDASETRSNETYSSETGESRSRKGRSVGDNSLVGKGQSPLSHSNESYPGRLVFVDIKVEPVSRRVRVQAEVANPDGLLRDGLMATMTVAATTALDTTRKD
jgi:multidrug efflux pump subunit AcrA (membrane-fusion protein)